MGTTSRSARSLEIKVVMIASDLELEKPLIFELPAVFTVAECDSALLFQHPIIHEGSEVKAGVKYVVRTDLMYATVS